MPRPVIRDLLFSHGISPGSRVLDAGSSDDKLVDYLGFLGIAAERVCLDADISRLPEHEYDLVIARQLDSYCKSLDSLASLTATAGLLATVRPGGFLILANDSRGQESHRVACLRRHLSSFPGACRTWRRGRFDLNSLKTASRGRARSDWQTFIREPAQASSSPQRCCPPVQRRAA